MAAKTDVRARYTKKVIRDSFFTLLRDQPINKITVKAICELAQINRSTFYRYYTDPFDLLAQIEEELLRHMLDMSFQGPEKALEGMMNEIKENNELYTLLFSENADHLYISKMVASSYGQFEEGFARRYPSLPPAQRKRVYYYIAQGAISVLIDWIDNGMQEDPKEMAAFLTRLDETVLGGCWGEASYT